MRRSHNSQFPPFILFRGRVYLSPSHIYRARQPPPVVTLAVFTKRLKVMTAAGTTSDDAIDEALHATPAGFKAKYAIRRTRVECEHGNVCLNDYYTEHRADDCLPYANFRLRVISLHQRERVDADALRDALRLAQTDWISFYGGGRHNSFVYRGELYPQCSGRKFHSIAAFLKTVGRHEARFTVWNRLKAGWDLDLALEAPVAPTSASEGSIYLITRRSTGQVYVGLTFTGLESRWQRHLTTAKRGASNRLATAIRMDGPGGFDKQVLEVVHEDVDLLRARERHWIATLDACGPNGLNTTAGGELAGPKGVPIKYDGENFPSIAEAARQLSDRMGLERHVVRSRLLADQPIPTKVRRHSKHPEAGSPLFRRWLSLLRRRGDQVAPEWVASYDRFKANVSPFDPDLNLMPIDNGKPIGPGNFAWGTRQEVVEQVHGKSHKVLGEFHGSLEAIACAFGIGVSTLKYRVFKKGMSFDEAVTQPVGKTSFRSATEEIVVDGIRFRSKRQAILHIARTRGVSEHAAKYGLSIGRFKPKASALEPESD